MRDGSWFVGGANLLREKKTTKLYEFDVSELLKLLPDLEAGEIITYLKLGNLYVLGKEYPMTFIVETEKRLG